MTRPAEYSFTQYLAAKQTVDDRALNREVRDHLSRAVARWPETPPLRVLEVGCGIGTMIERLLKWGVLRRAVYTAVDIQAENLVAARERLQSLAAVPDPASAEEGHLLIQDRDRRVLVDFEAVDFFEFAAREQGHASWDLLVAHAFLDLVDLATAIPLLLSLLRPGGLFYFTLNFDGATILEPPVDPDLDRHVEEFYHRSMDRRLTRGHPSGDSRTGRRLFNRLAAAGARVVAAGSSDWVVFPGEAGYPGDEAYFLHFMVETIRRALQGHPELDRERFENWIETRHAQIEANTLIYLAHQLDFFGYI